jgi:hypothetical protein
MLREDKLSMNQRRKKIATIALRLFMIYCIIYTAISLLFDYRAATYTSISEAACRSIFINASTEEELKQLLVKKFIPTFVFSFGEPADLETDVIVPYQIVLDQQNADRYVLRGAVVYPMDYGVSSVGIRLSFGTDGYSIFPSKTVLRALGSVFGHARIDSHVGDVEMFELYIKRADIKGYWEIDELGTYPHGDVKTYSADDIQCFRDSPIFYVSRGKHALYPSLQECNHSSIVHTTGIHLSSEYCSTGELYYPSTSPQFNVGDRTHPVNIFETSPLFVVNGIFAGENVWGSCFRGGLGDGENNKRCRSSFRWQ